MIAKWKKKKNLKPEIILEKIDSFITVSADKVISFANLEYFDAMATLQTMVEFPKRTKGLNKEELLSKAVSEVAKNGNIDKAKVIDSLNSLIRRKLSKKEEVYHLLTSISLSKPYPAKNITLEGAKIRILPGNYPKKYEGRDELIRRRYGFKFGQESRRYAKVIVTAMGKSPEGAGSECLRILDIQRAIWCLFSNSSMEIMGNLWSPINNIRLGEAHTLHKLNGKIATDVFWYDPNFVMKIPHKINSTKKYDDHFKWVMDKLEKCRYSEALKDSLLRYVRALDEKDQNVALIRLWSAIESLTVPPQGNYDTVIRRCSFLFKERRYYEQILEHLREYRNQNIHAGEQSMRAKSNCFQLQYFFYSLFLFHLNNVEEFSSLDEANNFLDLPSNKRTLENRMRLIDKALKFIS